MSKGFYVLAILVLVWISVLTASGQFNKVFGILTSNNLNLKISKTEMEEQRDYVDADRKIRFAANKGYATEIRRLDENRRNMLQAYYDENGEPVVTESGYHAIRREYNDKGQNNKIMYLDIEMRPVTVNGGYAAILRTYNAAGKAETDTYLDAEGKIVQRTNGYYGYRREYDVDGRVSRITYLDADGKTVNRREGYAVETRTYNGKGSLLQRRYFDQNGEPTSIGRMQYGIQYEDGKAFYLDEDGNTMRRLDNYLFRNPLIVILSAAMLILLGMIVPEKGRSVLFILYTGFIVYMTLVYREATNGTMSLIPFASYRRLFVNARTRQQILNNIWLFVPFGFLLQRTWKGKWNWLVPVVLSGLIELTQYVFKIGYCEIDDVISNVIGGMIGIGLGSIYLISHTKQKVH